MSRSADLQFMREALAEATAAFDRGEYPVGAVVVRDGSIISRSGNDTTRRNDPTAHAEISAIRRACEVLGRLKLPDCRLYTTLYPCPMCEMVIKEVALPEVVYGATSFRWIREVKFGGAVFEPIGPILEEECRGLFSKKLEEMGRADILDFERSGRHPKGEK